MTDKEFTQTKLRIKRSFDKWSRCCGLGWWADVQTYYYDSAKEFESAHGDGHDRAVATAEVDWPYKQATIRFNCERAVVLSDEEIDATVRHEICHLLINEMREWEHGNASGSALRHEEHVVTMLAQILLWVRVAGSEDAKKAKRKKR